MPTPPPPPPEYEIIEVVEEAPAEVGAARTLDDAALASRPARAAEDWLRATPGLHLASHGGRGKSQQFLVRGFDAEHGSAFAVDVEGAPLNESSNVHGHGYLDLGILPPSLVRGLSVRSGTPRASDPSYAVAGSASYSLGLMEPGLSVTAGAGSDASLGATAAWRPRRGSEGSFVIGDVAGGLAPGREFRVARGAAGVQHREGSSELRAFLLGTLSDYTDPGVLRAEDHARDPYQTYDFAGGGASGRLLGGARWSWVTDAAVADTTLWGTWRALSLAPNFTGYAHHGTRGDTVLQSQAGAGVGLRSRVGLRLDGRGWLRFGGEARHDAGASREVAATQSGRQVGAADELSWQASEVSGWSEAELRTGPVSITPGVRLLGTALTLPGGSLSSVAVGPAARGRVEVAPWVSVVGGVGRGFVPASAHEPGDGSPSAADSGEVGLAASVSGFDVGLTGFGVRVEDERAFDHVSGKSVIVGDTIRRGATVTAAWEPAPAVRLEGDLTVVDARRIATGELVSQAPRWLAGAGVSLLHAHVGAGHVSAGLFGRAVGPRPLPLGLVARPVATADATVELDLGSLAMNLALDNVAGAAWQEGTFVFASRTSPGAADSQRPVPHVAAGHPRTLRGSLTWRF